MWNFFKRKALNLECLEIKAMASGDQGLLLTEKVSWEGFPKYAEAVVSFLGGRIIERSADSPAERVWTTTIQGQSFWIAYEDYPLGVSLDPKDSEASSLIPTIRQRLLDLRASAK